MRMVLKRAKDNHCEIIERDNTSKTFRELVGGYIEIFRLTDKIIIVLNEEGKLLGLEPNIAVPCHDGVYEQIVGDIVFVEDDGGGDFVDISYESIECLKNIGLEIK